MRRPSMVVGRSAGCRRHRRGVEGREVVRDDEDCDHQCLMVMPPMASLSTRAGLGVGVRDAGFVTGPID